MTTIASHPKDRTLLFNRIMYGLFITLGIYSLIAHPLDWTTGLSNLGIALIFDPFDQKIPWPKRPLYQRVWLLTHLGVLCVLFLFFLL